MWLVNAIIVMVVMARLFVFGEPVTKPRSESSILYWRSRKQAYLDLARVSYIALMEIILDDKLFKSTPCLIKFGTKVVFINCISPHNNCKLFSYRGTMLKPALTYGML